MCLSIANLSFDVTSSSIEHFTRLLSTVNRLSLRTHIQKPFILQLYEPGSIDCDAAAV
jgi:hypothetical protein